MRLPADGEEAKRIVARARTGQAAIESIEAQTQRMPPPALYDLTELQRHANRLFGFSAQKTLDIAQALYERHKLISYPRTDSRHLSQDVAATLPRVVAAIAAPYREQLAPGTGERPLGRRFVDDAKVTDHHAIIPTATLAAQDSLSPDERKIYDLICRRLLSAWHDDHIWSVTTVITAIRNDALVDRYHTSGSAVQQVGWKVLDLAPAKAKKAAPGAADASEQELPPGLAKGQPQDVLDAEVLKKKTRAPKRLTEGTLLTAMETAGKTLDEKELSDAMKETGLGTPATRASIIEVLLKREYIVRNGKSLEATDKGIHLIEVVHPEVKSPVMTGQWEARLHHIQRGTAQLAPFVKGIEDYVRDVVGKVGQVPAKSNRDSAAPNRGILAPTRDAAAPTATRHRTANPPPLNPAPPIRAATVRERWMLRPSYQGGPLTELLQTAFGFPSFRTNQEAVCQAVIAGRDVLLVMPTGAGKSLCYQLPAVARGGTTLVISPLIALMEDQVAKLKERNFAVERIHSGRDRAASRQACIDYLNGALQFLFIAPERLARLRLPRNARQAQALAHRHRRSPLHLPMGPRFPPRLPHARPVSAHPPARPGHRPHRHRHARRAERYRRAVGTRCSPRTSFTASAATIWPSKSSRWRPRSAPRSPWNSSSKNPAARRSSTHRRARRPTSVAADLAQHFPCAAYHAGLDAVHRQRVQEEFLEGRIEVMVATIAFGMGIDKPDVRTVIHTALPGSLEAYYQEIGRAGRDGAPSRTILMHSYADRRTHDFFFERDYPDVKVLDSIFARLRAEPVEKAALQHQVRMDAESFDKALEKLWIHGGALVDFAENVSRGHEHWREPYITQGDSETAAARSDAALRREQRVPHGRPRASLWRSRGLAQSLRHLRFLRSRRVCRAALSPRHQCGARGGALRRHRPAFGQRAVHRQIAQPRPSLTVRSAATTLKRSWAPWPAPTSSASPTQSLRRTAKRFPTARRA